MTSVANTDKNPTAARAFFTHNPTGSARRASILSPTTRYLCGAAYKSEDFADTVIAELIEDGHRAVVPSIGYDLGPVLHHCLRARQLWFMQNAAITAILVLGAFLVPGSTVSLLYLALTLVGIRYLVRWPQLSRRQRLVVVGAVFGFSFVVPLLLALFSLSAFASSLGSERDGGESSPPARLEPSVGWMIVLALAVLATLLATRMSVLRTLTRDLAPGGQAPTAAVDRPLVRKRIDIIERAQHGNIVLHSGYDPFLGAGEVLHAWSLAIQLRRDDTMGGQLAMPDDDRVALDPVELNRHLKRSLAALGSAELPPHERIAGLALRDQIMGSGARWRGYPLIDQQSRQPYSFATPQAVEAIIRAPQTSARHFLRASVGAENREVAVDSGGTIVPAEYQNIVVSTFTHIAVEGGMLYVENVSTVLGPLRQEFLDIDQHSPGDENGAEPLLQALRALDTTTLLAPLRLLKAGGRAIVAKRNMTRAERDSGRSAVYDFGARAEVRQLASSPRPVTYLQRLDAEKYSKLMERRISEAVVGYLRSSGIDTSEYETRMNVFHNHGVFIRGDNKGPVAAGPGATALLNQADRSGRKGGKDGGDPQ